MKKIWFLPGLLIGALIMFAVCQYYLQPRAVGSAKIESDNTGYLRGVDTGTNQTTRHYDSLAVAKKVKDSIASIKPVVVHKKAPAPWKSPYAVNYNNDGTRRKD